MPSWRITAFDRTLARGICTSGIGALPFAASVALVDDFTLGEEVDVSLRRLPDGNAASYEVTRIAPTGWRSTCTVFRIDPQRFGDAAAYVIAHSIALQPM